MSIIDCLIIYHIGYFIHPDRLVLFFLTSDNIDITINIDILFKDHLLDRIKRNLEDRKNSDIITSINSKLEDINQTLKFLPICTISGEEYKKTQEHFEEIKNTFTS